MLPINEIIQGDCLEVMKDWPDNCVDLVLTDPPYGTTACSWDVVIPLEPMWKHLKRLITARGVIILTGSQPFTSKLVMSNIKMFKYEWIWNKIGGANFMNLKNRPWKTQEQLLVFSETADFTFNPIRCDRAESSLKRDPMGGRNVPNGSNAQHYGITGTRVLAVPEQRHPIDILNFSNHETKRYEMKHPTKKPVALMKYMVSTYTNKGDTILDPFLGSGTTAVACKELGRNYIGIELNQEYIDIANRRLLQEVLPL